MTQSVIMHSDTSSELGARSVNWSPLILGALTFFGIEFCFALLGTAIGLSLFEIGRETPGPGSFVAAGIYSFVSTLISFFCAGYVASRFGEFRQARRTLLHGFGTWVLVAAISAYFGAAANLRGVERGIRTDDARRAAAGTSAFGFLSLLAGIPVCVFGSLGAHRRKYAFEDRLTNVFDRSSDHRPRRIG